MEARAASQIRQKPPSPKTTILIEYCCGQNSKLMTQWRKNGGVGIRVCLPEWDASNPKNHYRDYRNRESVSGCRETREDARITAMQSVVTLVKHHNIPWPTVSRPTSREAEGVSEDA